MADKIKEAINELLESIAGESTYGNLYEAIDIVQQHIKELETENKKLKDLYNTESLRAYIGRLKQAEDILKDVEMDVCYCNELIENIQPCPVCKAGYYFKLKKQAFEGM